MPKVEAYLDSTITSFSRAGDLNNLTFLAHAERVTYIGFRLGKQLRLGQTELNELILSTLLHDIGIMTDAEQLLLADLEPRPNRTSAHCRNGYRLLRSTTTFGPFARNVLEHHDYYSPEIRVIPAIIHVADRVDILLDRKRYALWQVEDLLRYFKSKAGSIFSPEVVDALHSVASIPSFWLDLEYGKYRFVDEEYDFRRVLTLDELEEIAELMATIVDHKSPFTAAHSQGVAKVAAFLATQLNMPEHRVRLVKTAGLLHDIGKLSIPDEILMFPGSLSRDQRAVMKQHTYHSYHLISGIGPGAKRLAGWAAFHHERLDGSGYPFGLKAPDLEPEARLMAVADITQSLLESRPYRDGLSTAKVTQILHHSVKSGHLDADLTDVAVAHVDQIKEFIGQAEK